MFSGSLKQSRQSCLFHIQLHCYLISEKLKGILFQPCGKASLQGGSKSKVGSGHGRVRTSSFIELLLRAGQVPETRRLLLMQHFSWLVGWIPRRSWLSNQCDGGGTIGEGIADATAGQDNGLRSLQLQKTRECEWKGQSVNDLSQCFQTGKITEEEKAGFTPYRR